MNISDHFSTNQKFNIKKAKSKHGTIHVWLFCNGNILIKRIDQSAKKIDIEDLTLSTDTIDDILHEIEYEWSILCSFNDLQEIYNFEYSQDDSRVAIRGYILNVKLTEEQIALVQEKYNGYFINCDELDDRFKNLSKDWICKEAFYLLIDHLYINRI